MKEPKDALELVALPEKSNILMFVTSLAAQYLLNTRYRRNGRCLAL
jgi:hypothetical protein